MTNIDIGFVVLHYLVEEETIECVSSIRKNIDTAQNKYKIVIVDNHSQNNSFEILTNLYKGDSDVILIKNEENLGFAQGNNVGINYLNDRYDVEFICCLNNDVYLLENNLLDKLQREYQRSQFAVLGPLILSGDGRYDSNPQRVANIKTKRDIEKQLERAKRMIFIYKYHLGGFYAFYRHIKSLRRQKSDLFTVQLEENVQLSGACLVFSKKYFEKFDGFYPETFLYKEEDILAFLLKSEKLTSIFDPSIIVYHKEDASTDATLNGERKKNIFVFTEYMKSLQVLLKLFEEKVESK